MSFILDALRKSENERKRNEVPGLADAIVQPRSKNRSLWIPLAALLAGINISLLLVMWLVSDDPPETPAPGPNTSAARPLTGELPRRLADELPPKPTTPPPAAQQAAVSPPPPAAASAPVAAAPAVATPPAPPQSSANSNLPTYTELVLAGSISVKPLRVDIHVSSENADERFVFINMSKYREGDTTSEGPIVNEINDSGVVLSHQGRQFLLMRE